MKKPAWQFTIGYLTAVAVIGCGDASESADPGSGIDAASTGLDDLYQAAIEDARIAEPSTAAVVWPTAGAMTSDTPPSAVSVTFCLAALYARNERCAST